MNLPPSAAASASAPSAPRSSWPRRLVNAAVALVVLAVAAAMFVFSYAGVHAIALQGGVSVQLARYYPGLFDAVLVIACVAAVTLRDARWWARCWAWLVVIVILAGIGTTDVLHAMNYGLRQRPTEGTVAAAPVVAVLLAFSLLLTMLRQSRPQASDATLGRRARSGRRGTGQQPTAPMDITPVDMFPVDMYPVDALPVAAGAVPRPPAPPIALPPAPADLPDTQEIPASASEAGEDLVDPATAATREEHALAATASATPGTELTAEAPATSDNLATSDHPNPPTEPNEPVTPEAPSAPVAADPSTGPSPQPVQEPRPAPHAIRYASSAAMESDDYWDSDVDPALAGQVYPVLTSDPDIDMSGYQPEEPQDIDDSDAPPFATAPFASVPRLNRMRVTPTPPTDDED